MIFHVLVEGSSDEPTVMELLVRRFGMVRGSQFRVHPHRGKGRIPADLHAPPPVTDQSLLGQLPAKLRSYSVNGPDSCVVVLVDQDDDDCAALLTSLQLMLAGLTRRPRNVLFRIAMEEIEAWFLADRPAVLAAYPHASFANVPAGEPDLIDDPSDVLAECLGVREATGQRKAEWAKQIGPHLDLNNPASPSLAKFIEGIERFWNMAPAPLPRRRTLPARPPN